MSTNGGKAAGQPATFDVVVNGRPWRLALEPDQTSGRYHVGVKGQRRTFDVAWIDETTISMIEAGSSASTVTEAGIGGKPGGDLSVSIEGRLFSVSVAVQGKPSRSHSGARHGEAINGPTNIVTPMPGRVVRVLVSEGDRVAAGQGVIVVEAMKMENELRANKDGLVRQVRGKAGDAVEAGAVLVVID